MRGWPARRWCECRGGRTSASTSTRSTRPRQATPGAKLLFLTSPNNPDGSLLTPRDLASVLRLPLFVVVDEAYIEFAGLERSVADWVLVHDNLAVLRTFSKWAGWRGCGWATGCSRRG